MSIDVKQFRDFIIRPTLSALGLESEDAVNLMLGTALQESDLSFIKQLGGGPALGVYQMEPATHQDIWENYLDYRDDLAAKVRVFSLADGKSSNELVGNLFYATAMSRIHYLRVPAAIPSDVEGWADYWKEHYNTFEGDGTVEEFIESYNEGTFGL